MKNMTGIAISIVLGLLIVGAVACTKTPASEPDSGPVARSEPTSVPATDQPGETEMVEVLAPIQDVRVDIAESFPPQYFLAVTSGLPNGCVEFDGYDVARHGYTVMVKVTNLEPAPRSLIACTERYGIVETNIPLGSDFEPGKTYIVQVNDISETFTTQGVAGAEEPVEVEQDAAIESAAIEYGAGPSGQSELVVVSGLPSSCHEFGRHNLMQGGDTIRVQVTNLVQIGVPCDEEYRTVETRIALGADIGPCETYVVEVNGKTQRVQAIGTTMKCRVPEPVETTTSSADPTMVEVLAPIENVEVGFAKSLPPIYFLVVRSGLPNGCVKYAGHQVAVEGQMIKVSVLNVRPEGGGIACTEMYGTIENRIELGRDFEPGKTYTVVVNGTFETSFDTPGRVSKPTGPQVDEPELPKLGQPFQIKLGDTAAVESEGLKLDFAEVVEDSRCSTDVVCVWAGQATVSIGVALPSGHLGFHELTVEIQKSDPKTVPVGGYLIGALVLDPYPTTAERGGEPGYAVTLLVTRDPDADEDVSDHVDSDGSDRPDGGATGSDSAQSAPVEVTLHWKPVEGEPLTVLLTADLAGGPDNNQDLYCQSTIWDFGDGMGVASMPSCMIWTPDIDIARLFTQTYTYDAPGAYAVTFTYGPLAPATQTVEVR